LNIHCNCIALSKICSKLRIGIGFHDCQVTTQTIQENGCMNLDDVNLTVKL